MSRLSFNQITSGHASLAEAVDACVKHGVEWIAPWRHKLSAKPAEDARIIREAGLKVSSLCRGGMFPAATPAERSDRIDDNRRAIEEAAILGAGVLVLVCGPAPGRDLDAARRMVEDSLAVLAPVARAAGVQLGIEPLHPMFAATRSVVVTLEHSLKMAERFGPEVGVVIDVYHVWWDPNLYALIDRARGNIVGFHVSDWIPLLADPLMSRGMMGDGSIELRRIRAAIDAAGYTGPIEVEIFNETLWRRPPEETVRLCAARFEEHVA
jgi:sugar phosphate isomerase/epimerase